MRRFHSGHLRGAFPLILLVVTTIGCASITGVPATRPPTATPTSALPPAVQTADALSAAIATYIASIATAAPRWTATAQIAAKETLAAQPGLTATPGKRPTPGTATPTFASADATPVPPAFTDTPTLPSVVQTADALNAAIATYIALFPTQTGTPFPALQTVEVQFAALGTVGASLGSAAQTGQTATATATPTPDLAGRGIGGGNAGGIGNGDGNGNGNGGGNGGSNGGNSGGSSSGGSTSSDGGGAGGPYVVKQLRSLGGEVISGQVCSVTKPFAVNALSPHVAWVFGFLPQDATHGRVTYAYSIPSAGEAHDAAGTYTLSPAGADGALLLSLAVSDHVTFKGFDGKIPVQYQFQLVPSTSGPCP